MATSTKKTAAKAAVPPKAKKPQDHQAPATEQVKEMLKATVRGVEWKVDPDTMDDFELLDDLNALDQRADATRMPSVLRRLLTIPDADGDPDASQWRRAMAVLRDEKTQRVSVDAGSNFVWELLEKLNPNSSSS